MASIWIFSVLYARLVESLILFSSARNASAHRKSIDLDQYTHCLCVSQHKRTNELRIDSTEWQAIRIFTECSQNRYERAKKKIETYCTWARTNRPQWHPILLISIEHSSERRQCEQQKFKVNAAEREYPNDSSSLAFVKTYDEFQWKIDSFMLVVPKPLIGFWVQCC